MFCDKLLVCHWSAAVSRSCKKTRSCMPTKFPTLVLAFVIRPTFCSVLFSNRRFAAIISGVFRWSLWIPRLSVRRRSRRTYSTHFEIFRRRFDGVVIYFFNSDFKFFDDASEFSVCSFYFVFIFSLKVYVNFSSVFYRDYRPSRRRVVILSTTTQGIRLRRRVDVFSTTLDTTQTRFIFVAVI